MQPRALSGAILRPFNHGLLRHDGRVTVRRDFLDVGAVTVRGILGVEALDVAVVVADEDTLFTVWTVAEDVSGCQGHEDEVDKRRGEGNVADNQVAFDGLLGAVREVLAREGDDLGEDGGRDARLGDDAGSGGKNDSGWNEGGNPKDDGKGKGSLLDSDGHQGLPVVRSEVTKNVHDEAQDGRDSSSSRDGSSGTQGIGDMEGRTRNVGLDELLLVNANSETP